MSSLCELQVLLPEQLLKFFHENANSDPNVSGLQVPLFLFPFIQLLSLKLELNSKCTLITSCFLHPMHLWYREMTFSGSSL